MKNLKKVAITLCSLIAVFSPLANADITTSNTFRVECESINNYSETCNLPQGVVSVILKKRFSSRSCDKNISWFVNNDRIEVIKGCRARFEVTLNRSATIQNFTCASNNNGYNECFVLNNQASPVWIYDRHSKAKCYRSEIIELGSWGETSNSSGTEVFVNKGCRATFSVEITPT